ncbi:uncharacterized protein LOC133803429 isoform X2 [Humulus lupulus]|uniref:uncharacterized protein LOC133803429 isoform X2 n=1 Tax=Humulus lupulus TaxID=3486 RepID=UPI002B4016FA|nr:uncharacterized protein LOC133803429 isoform X2 [Humulus lupulus]
MLGVSLDLSLSFSHGRKMKKAWMNGRVRTEASLGDRLRTEMMRQHHCLTVTLSLSISLPHSLFLSLRHCLVRSSLCLLQMCDRVMELEAWGVQQGGLVMDSTGWLSCGCDGACGGGSCDRFDFGKVALQQMISSRCYITR